MSAPSRRTLLGAAAASGLLGWPLVARAQPSGRIWRIGVLETTDSDMNRANMDAFRNALRELGYAEGRNFVIEYRSAAGRGERFAELAAELARLKVDLIVTRGTPAALAAKQASATIPVVMASSGEPVGSGVIAGLASPGGNITGLSSLNTGIEPKRLELLMEIVPGLKSVGALFNIGNPVSGARWQVLESSARSRGLAVTLLDVRAPGDLDPAFATATRAGCEALVVGIDALTQASAKTIAALAARHRLPAIYASREFVDAGGLIAYAVSYPHLYARAAGFVDKILKGAKPADLPVEQPTNFELVISLRAAAALGIVIPPTILARADEVIE